MAQDPRPFPAFEVVDAAGRVRITLSTGEQVEFNVADLNSPLELVELRHPDFEAMYAVQRWLWARETNLGGAFSDPATIQAYILATWTPMEVPA